MRRPVAIPRTARWAAPVVAVTAIAGLLSSVMINVAQAAPSLPRRTPAVLLADALRAAPVPLSGRVVQTASLGIPALPGMTQPSSALSLLAGSHALRVWYGGPGRARVAVLAPMGETDLITNGRTAWLWQSASDSVLRLSRARGPKAITARVAGPGAPLTPASGAPLTPASAATQALAAVDPSTRVTTQANVTVAHQAAYQLVLTPRPSGSLISRVTLALDGRHPGVPLRVQVFAKGMRAPALQVGFTSVTFTAPASGTFTFTPPRGARVRTVTPASLPRLAASASARGPSGVIGRGWTAVGYFPARELTALAGQGSAAGAAGQATRAAAGDSGSVSAGDVVAALMGSARQVHGKWGSGRLLRTSLLSVLITSSGRAFAGPVSPAVLFAAAGRRG